MSITKKQLQKEIEKTYRDCWKYYKEDLKQERISWQNIRDVDEKCDFQGWEDVGFFAGYITALKVLKGD